MEETGVRLATLEPLGISWSMPGISTERMHLYLAPYSAADRIGDGGGLDEEHEQIRVDELPLRELAAAVDDGTIGDLKTAYLISRLRLRRPELFA